MRYNSVKGYFTDDPTLDQAPISGDNFDPDRFSAGSPIAVAALVPQQVDVLYLTEPGNTNAISLTDINQGSLNDCYLLSAIGEIAMLKPSFISNMIKVNSNGTETVTLYESSNGVLLNPYSSFGYGAIKTVTEVVSNVFPTFAVNGGAGQDVVGNLKEIWPQVIEKAVAQLDSFDPTAKMSPYGAIDFGGNPAVAMEVLTGRAATSILPTQVTFAFLTAAIKANDLITFDTNIDVNYGLNNMVGNHSYMFESLTGTGPTALVHLGNPWGTGQPTAIQVNQLDQSFARVDIGHLTNSISR